MKQKKGKDNTMKNTSKIFGHTVIAAIGFVALLLTSCGDGSGDDSGGGGGGSGGGGGGGGTGGGTPPEQQTTAERWGKWVDDTSTATLNYLVDPGDGMCTITVGGTADLDRWKAGARYSYTAEKGKLYDYTFEAWTRSGARKLWVQYYEDNDERIYLVDSVSLTTTRTTYTVNGTNIPKSGIRPLVFQCADQLGTFYVKILTISEYEYDDSQTKTFTSVDAFKTWLPAQPNNTAARPYRVKLNIDNEGDFKTLSTTWYNNSDKYVYLDLSGSTITEIPGGAFLAYVESETMIYSKDCDTLTGITIPNNITTIGEMAFVSCHNLTTINVAAGNTAYSSVDGVLYNKNKTTLIQYPGGKTGAFTIPNNVTSIGEGAFFSYWNLTSVTIPHSVTSIGEWAFYSCYNLTSVTFQGTIPSSGFHYNAFSSIGDLRDKYLARGIGTYTTTAPVVENSKWTKQP
ncbi:MAG: leucine-rich repeat domain-containing protein [Treponema sp.]|jgi:hypothetical protein|nr:leucine-rich repeat domain-containing protein [Treponema sp.]